MVAKNVCLLFVIIGAVYSQGPNAQSDDVMSQLSKSFGNQYDKGLLQDIFGGRPRRRSILKEKCEKYAKPNPIAEGQNPFDDFRKCFSGVVEVEQIFKKLSENRTEEAVNMFCPQTWRLEECTNTLVSKMRPCFNVVENSHLDNMLDGVHKIFQFLCYNGGERIFQFAEEGARPCTGQELHPVSDCLLNKYGSSWPHYPDVSDEALEENIFEDPILKGLCLDGLALRDCSAGAFRRCGWHARERITNSLMNIALRGSPCQDLVPAGAGGVGGSLALLATAAAAVLLM